MHTRRKFLGVVLALTCGIAACGGGSNDGAADRAAPVTQPPPPRSFTLAASGDLLVHSPIAARAKSNNGGTGFDFRPMFAPVQPIISAADLAICHMETPLSKDDQNLSYYPVFNVPHEIAAAAKDAGYDGCSTASNHTFDRGTAGVEATLGHLEAVGLGHAGSYRTAEERATPKIYDISGVKVGHLSFTYGLNGYVLPTGQPWWVAINDRDRILADARASRAAGAEVVVLSIHWGEENRADPTPEQSALARALLESGEIDLILGDHVHVVQPVEKIGERYVVYGMGNFLSNQSAECCPAASQDGIIVGATFEERDGRFGVRELRYTPTWVDRSTYRILPVQRTLAEPGTPAPLRAALEKSLQRTNEVVNRLGASAAGVTPLP